VERELYQTSNSAKGKFFLGIANEIAIEELRQAGMRVPFKEK